MAVESKAPVCAVVGVGPGNGEAFARRFAADGYVVALLARRAELDAKLAAELPGAKAYSCDVADKASIEAAFAKIRADLGEVDVLIFNAGSGVWGNVEDVSAEDLERAWRINTLGLFLTSREAIPAMRRRGSGAIVVVGATASRRGAAGAAAFAQAKMAQRALAESMARHLGPAGNPRRAHHRRRNRRRPKNPRALPGPSGRRVHRSGWRCGDRREPRQAGSLRLEFRGRSAAVRGKVVMRSLQAAGASSPGSSLNVLISKSGAPGSRSRRWPYRLHQTTRMPKSEAACASQALDDWNEIALAGNCNVSSVY